MAACVLAPRGPDAVACVGTNSGRVRGQWTLTVSALAALIYHILIFHPFLSVHAFDDPHTAVMYDSESLSEAADGADVISVNDRRGIPAPFPSLAVGACIAPADYLLLLILSPDQPPKA